MAEKRQSGNPERIPWHPAFAQAMRMELEQYKDLLEFHDEYRLTSEPLEIDMLIIKKAPELSIDKNIARIFMNVNLVEYKSPEDYVSVYDFYKTLGYTCLYAALNRHDLRDMTVTIVETRHPRELFKYVREDERCAIKEESPGIYRITGHWMPIQVIESKKLPPDENLWLKGLDSELNTETAGSILELSRKKNGPEIAAYLYAVLLANAKTIQEVLKMDKAEEITLDEVLEEAGLTKKWEERGEARGEKTAWGKVLTLLEQGYTVDELKRMAPGGLSSSKRETMNNEQ
jgi:hypothetical protein